MLAKYRALLQRIRAALPETRIIVMSYYPVNRTELFETGWFGARTNAEIDAVNLRLQTMAVDLGLEYVDVTACLRNGDGNLEEAISVDGMHMLPDGYARVLEILAPLMA